MTNLAVGNLLCNHIENPLGYQLEGQPRLSWIVQGDADAPLSCTRVEVARDADFARMLYDSGWRADIDSLGFLPPLSLEPRTRYYWRVSVEAGGRTASAVSWFETAKLEEPWRAMWIAPEDPPARHPILFRDFALDRPVRSARAYVCGLGLYKLHVNGNEAGDEQLAPGLCAYDKWLPYQTYDVTELLTEGANTVEIALGNGWYKGRYGISEGRAFHYGEEFACICEIVAVLDDGSERTIATDADWRYRLSVIVDSGIFDGEVRDDTLDPGPAARVKRADIPMSLLEPRRSPPIRIMHRLKPVEILHTPAGETVLDMGQNMVGWLEFTCRAPKGSRIHLQFGETLQHGNFYRDNLRTALAEFRYVSDGTVQIVRPRFTFYGFRYVRLTAWPQEVSADDFTGLVLYSALRETGRIVTGNEKVNRLFENTLWGQRGNFLDVPTDCPQRDERMGWTGDAQVFFGTAAFNMDVAAFYAKYCYDLMREQQALGGAVPVVIPKHDVTQAGACAWGDAAVIIPWNHYVRYGDKGILERQYPSMKAWVEYIRRHDAKTGDTRLWKGDFHYGDWLSLDGEDPIGNRFGGTERTYLASCYYRHSARLTAKAARVLGRDAEADAYEALSEEVRAAIVAEYVTSSGRLALTTQTAYVLALYMDILPERWRERTAYALQCKLKESGYHLRTGFIGTPYLCRILSATGSNNIAYRLLLQEDFPSWLYEVNMGATTIWERWNSILPDGSISDTGMNSLNHYSYGSIVEWLYRDAAGIEPMEAFPGFRKFRLVPKPDRLLGSLSATYHSPVGTIASAWRYLDSGELALDFTVPYGATALATLPGHPDGASERPLGPGTHAFRYLPVDACAPAYGIDTPIREIYENPGAQAALRQALPELTDMMLFPMMAGERSLRDFMREGFVTWTDAQAQALAESMSAAARPRSPGA